MLAVLARIIHSNNPTNANNNVIAE